MRKTFSLVPAERLERSILLIRGEKVMLDADLAEMYGVPTKVLLQAVKRNIDRFPDDFAFQLTYQEVRDLRSHFVTSSLQGREKIEYSSRPECTERMLGKKQLVSSRAQLAISGLSPSETIAPVSAVLEGILTHGGRRYKPYVFTEHGVAMLSSILNSPRAVSVNIQIVRTFVRLRQLLSSNAELARKLAALEKKYDAQFRVVFDAIRELMAPPESKNKKRIGFGRE